MTASSNQGSTSLSAKVSLAGAILVALGSTSAMAMSDANLVIVTSFSNDVTDVYEKAFEEKYPGVNVEVLSKKTTAGIKYLQETASNNKSDISGHQHPMLSKYSKTTTFLLHTSLQSRVSPKQSAPFLLMTRTVSTKALRFPAMDYVEHPLHESQKTANAERMAGFGKADLSQPCRHVRTFTFRHDSPDS